jgi:hypothetical protein
MTNLSIASFNVKNLIGPDQEYDRFQSYTPEEYAWNTDWLAEQLQTMNSDIVGFHEIFAESAVHDVTKMADAEGIAGNATHIPGPAKRYRRKAIFRELPEPVDIDFGRMGPDEGGSLRLTRLSRPIPKDRIPLGRHAVTVLNCHLKSKPGEFAQPKNGSHPKAPHNKLAADHGQIIAHMRLKD